MSSGLVLLNIHTLPKSSESSKLNEINMSVDNADFNGTCFYMNSSFVCYIMNHNSIGYIKGGNEISTNRYSR